MLTIRKASEQTGLSADTLRYYERIGLLPPIARNNGGQRRYDEADVARLRFVKRAQTMDFSLQEIGQLLTLRDRPDDVREDVRSLTKRKLADIEHRIRNLSDLRDELQALVAQCRSSTGACPIISRMEARQEHT